ADARIFPRVRKTDLTAVTLFSPLRNLLKEPSPVLLQELQTPLNRERRVELRRLHPYEALFQNRHLFTQQVIEVHHVAITGQQYPPAAPEEARNQELPLLDERAPASRLRAKQIEAIPDLAR